MRALEGLRILDFTHMLSGPYATMMLADMGAETIKIEPPVKGEATRKLLATDPDHSIDGMGAYFLTLGRNKKSLTLDIRTTAGAQVFADLVKISDVVVYNFRAGMGEKLGIQYSQLCEINPRIITCSISGFGETGPLKNNASFDAVAQAVGGGMSLTGNADSPLRSGIPIGDLGGGLMATIGILGALQARQTTGKGQHIDISMQDAQVSLLNYIATMTFLSGKQPQPSGNAHFVHVPYDSFAASDGFLIVAVITDAQWEQLVSVLNLRELNNPENKTQPGRLKNKVNITNNLNSLFATNCKSHWLALLQSVGIPSAPVNSLPEVLNSEHIQARNMVVSVKHPNGTQTKQPGNPVKYSGTPCDLFTPPPLLGSDNEEILSQLLKFSDDKISQLRNEGVI